MYIKNRNNQPTAPPYYSGWFQTIKKAGLACLFYKIRKRLSCDRSALYNLPDRHPRSRFGKDYGNFSAGMEAAANTGKTNKAEPAPLSPFTNIPAFNERNKIIQMDFGRPPIASPESEVFLENMPAIVLPDTYLFPTRGPSCFQGRIIRITPVPSLIKSGTVRHIVRSPRPIRSTRSGLAIYRRPKPTASASLRS